MLLAIADIANDSGDAYPGIDRLAAKCNISHRCAQESIRELEREGELKVFENVGTKTKSGWTNLYRIVLEGVQQTEVRTPTGEKAVARAITDKKSRLFPKEVQTVAPLSNSHQETTGVQTVAPDGVQLDSPHGVQTVAPNPSVYPSGEQSDSNPPIPPYPIPDIQEQADEVIAKVAAITPKPVDEDQAARLLIKAYLDTTKSADTGMVNSNPRNQEALKLYDLGMTPFHIGLYLKRNKTEAGYWQGKNVPWKVLIGEIVSHFETRPAVTYTFVPEVPIPPVVISDGPKANFTIEEFDALLEATSKAMDF